MNEQKIMDLLGLVRRAGKLVSGENNLEAVLKKNVRLGLIIVAKDASENTKKKFKSMSKKRNLSYVEFGEKKTLGKCIGKASRAVVGVTDFNLSQKIKQLLGDHVM